MDENKIVEILLALFVLLVIFAFVYVCAKEDSDQSGYYRNNFRNNYVGDSVEREADKRFIYTPMKDPPSSFQKTAAVNQPSQLRKGGIIPIDDGLNEYQASAYPIFMLNEKRIGNNPADDADKINKFYADYRIGGGRDLDTQLHHDAIASMKPNYTIYA